MKMMKGNTRPQEFWIAAVLIAPALYFIYVKTSFSSELLISSVLTAILIFIGIEDMQNKTSQPLLIMPLFLIQAILIFAQNTDNLVLIIDYAAGMVLSGTCFLLIFAITRGGINLQDVVLISCSGWVLGLQKIMCAMLVTSVFITLQALVSLIIRPSRKMLLPSIVFIFLGCITSIFLY
jgi:Flp pilus assembly protein protease CpaA